MAIGAFLAMLFFGVLDPDWSWTGHAEATLTDSEGLVQVMDGDPIPPPPKP